MTDTDPEVPASSAGKMQQDAMHLYDTHAARLYAVALRITGDSGTAGEVIEQVFVAIATGRASLETRAGSADAALIRYTRDCALARVGPAAPPPQSEAAPTPRALVEETFFGGKGIAVLAREHSLTEEAVRNMLRDGMAQLRREFATRKTK